VLTTGGGTGGGRCVFRGEESSPIRQFDLEQSATGAVGTLITIGAGLVCRVIVLIVAAVLARYMQDEAAQMLT
jgi:hypothetical protein